MSQNLSTEETLLTVTEAYQSLYEFLRRVYTESQWDSISDLLSAISTLNDGRVVDEAFWDMWIESIERAKNGEVITASRPSAKL